jgi:hypothetical protein
MDRAEGEIVEAKLVCKINNIAIQKHEVQIGCKRPNSDRVIYRKTHKVFTALSPKGNVLMENKKFIVVKKFAAGNTMYAGLLR